MIALRVYVSGPLTNLEESEKNLLRDFYSDIGALCRDKGLIAYVPHENGTDPDTNPDVSPEVVTKTDLAELAVSDLVIAYVGKKSLGVGAEIDRADVNNIDVILLCEDKRKVSRLIRGYSIVRSIIEMSSFHEGLERLSEVLDKWLASKPPRAEGFLVDNQLAARLAAREIQIVAPDGSDVVTLNEQQEPCFSADERQLDAHGYKLRAGRVYSFRKRRWIDLDAAPRKRYIIRRNEHVIVETYERISLPKDVMGMITSLARLTLLGFYHSATTIHPGYGKRKDGVSVLRVAIYNGGPSRISLAYKDRFCRIVFLHSSKLASIEAPLKDTVFSENEVYISQQQRRVNLFSYTIDLSLFALGFIAAIAAITLGALGRWQEAAIPTSAVAIFFTGLAFIRRYR